MRKKSNGMGTIGKEKNPNLKKPWYAKVSEDGKRKHLGHFETEAEAQEAINEYKKKLEKQEEEGCEIVTFMTFSKLFNDMVADYCVRNEPSDSRLMGFHSTQKHLTDNIKKSRLDQMNYKTWEIFFKNLKEKGLGYSTIKRIRTDCIMTYKYAQKLDYTGVNYPKLYELGKSPNKGKAKIFEDVQIFQLVWMQNMGNAEARFAVDTTLMLIYTGVRISELLGLKTKNVHISENYFDIETSKTEAGIRSVPIHRCLNGIIQKYYDKNNEYLFTMPGTKKKYSYANYRDSYWDRLRVELNWDEDMTPHNCRKTCASLLKRYEVDTTYIKLILGHEGALDLTEKTYTNVDISKLVEAINKIPRPDKLS